MVVPEEAVMPGSQNTSILITIPGSVISATKNLTGIAGVYRATYSSLMDIIKEADIPHYM